MVPIRAISIDGKTTAVLDAEVNADCQKQQQEGEAPKWHHRVVRATLISLAAAVCIDQRPVPAATNDMGVFGDFFADLMKTYGRADLFELVFTDAGFTSEKNARRMDEAQKADVMRLRANQPDLEHEARRVLLAKARAVPGISHLSR